MAAGSPEPDPGARPRDAKLVTAPPPEPGAHLEDQLPALGASSDAGQLIALLAASVWGVEKEHGVGNNAHGLALLVLGALPLAPLQPSIDRHTAALVHEAGDALAGSAESADVEEIGALVELALGTA
jgi:hypothetical protein